MFLSNLVEPSIFNLSSYCRGRG